MIPPASPNASRGRYAADRRTYLVADKADMIRLKLLTHIAWLSLVEVEFILEYLRTIDEVASVRRGWREEGVMWKSDSVSNQRKCHCYSCVLGLGCRTLDTPQALRRTCLSSIHVMYTAPRLPPRKFYVWFPFVFLGFSFTLWYYQTLDTVPITYQKTHAHPPAQFTTYGHSNCPLEISAQLIEEATIKRSICRQYSPFEIRRWRIATVTAQFGKAEEHYQNAFRTHLLHTLVHSIDVKVMCDPIIDDLWNKPAFILQILMQEMLKPAHERLEWIEWVDRDTLILDQCRPVASFLPPPEVQLETETHLLATRDWNGLNNGIFLVRVNQWAINLFTAILAFRHYKPDVNCVLANSLRWSMFCGLRSSGTMCNMHRSIGSMATRENERICLRHERVSSAWTSVMSGEEITWSILRVGGIGTW